MNKMKAISPNPVTLLLRMFSSIWLGLFLLILLFIYCTIGSGMPTFRQQPSYEMTEYEWFNWWPFVVLLALICVNVTTTTLRKIPLRVVNLGVWTIHVGVIVMSVGSYVYFSQKIEADAPVFRRAVAIKVPGVEQISRLPVIPGSNTVINTKEGLWHFTVQNTHAAWPIMSEPDKGKKTLSINVSVVAPDGNRFIRQLLAGYPQYTEDVLPNQGRAIRVIGRKLVDERLELSLDYEPQQYLYHKDTWALYVREVGEKEWKQRPLRGMPRYNDYIGNLDDVLVEHPLEARPLDLAVPASIEADPLQAAEVRVTSYLRYADMQLRWRNDGELNPVLQMEYSLSSDSAEPMRASLVAFGPPEQRRISAGAIGFRWLEDAKELATAPKVPWASVSLQVPGIEQPLQVTLRTDVLQGDNGVFTAIGETGYRYRVRKAAEHQSIDAIGATVSYAIVDILGPDVAFQRMVCDPPNMTFDMKLIEQNGQYITTGKPQVPDEAFKTTFYPSNPPIMIYALPAGRLVALANGEHGRLDERELRPGEWVDFTSLYNTPIKFRALSLMERAVPEIKPFIVKPEERIRDAMNQYSLIRLSLKEGDQTSQYWLRYHHHVLPDDRYSYANRFPFRPSVVTLKDGRKVELMFSRERSVLPHPVALDDFTLISHEGGFTGSALTIRNYESQLIFQDKGTWSSPVAITVNDPSPYGKLWFFQSSWDPPSRDDPNSGMLFTGVGIANREGVYTQLIGSSLIVLGAMYAFYVKPIIKRRRKLAALAKHGMLTDESETSEHQTSQAEEALTTSARV